MNNQNNQSIWSSVNSIPQAMLQGVQVATEVLQIQAEEDKCYISIWLGIGKSVYFLWQ